MKEKIIFILIIIYLIWLGVTVVSIAADVRIIADILQIDEVEIEYIEFTD